MAKHEQEKPERAQKEIALFREYEMSGALPYLQLDARGQTRLMVNNEHFVMLAGELHNSSATNLDELDVIFARLTRLHLNTVILPISWELLEPEEGQFDYTLVDGILAAARKHDLRLILLWFGAWKNGKSCYCPPWVQIDISRFPRVQLTPGLDADVISPFGPAITQADARAFSALLTRIKEVDTDYRVVMVQPENEIGILGAPRDCSPLANAAFANLVPDVLLDYLRTHKETLVPEVAGVLNEADLVSGTTWGTAFGDMANEIFMVWHMASHVETVVAAGRAIHDIPTYVNAWLRQHSGHKAGQYPSGGPVAHMIDIWRAAAPHIDLLAPDIYLDSFRQVCDEYAASENPLFIPEAKWDERSASTVFYALGQHTALGFGPFAIDDVLEGAPLAETYALLEGMQPFLREHLCRGEVIGFYQQDEKENSWCRLGDLRVFLETPQPRSKVPVPGGGMLFRLSEDEVLAVGRNYRLGFAPPNAEETLGACIELLSAEEGTFVCGEWIPRRQLNGDETIHARYVPLFVGLTCVRARLNLKVMPLQFQTEWQFAN